MVIYTFKNEDGSAFGQIVTDNIGEQLQFMITETPAVNPAMVQLGFSWTVEPVNELDFITFAKNKSLILTKWIQNGVESKVVTLVEKEVPLTGITLNPTSVTTTVANKDTAQEVSFTLAPEGATVPNGFEVSGTVAGVTVAIDETNKKLTVNFPGASGAVSGNVDLVSKDYSSVKATLAISVTA